MKIKLEIYHPYVKNKIDEAVEDLDFILNKYPDDEEVKNKLMHAKLHMIALYRELKLIDDDQYKLIYWQWQADMYGDENTKFMKELQEQVKTQKGG